MIKFLDTIRKGKILVSDGAMGTRLASKGIDIMKCPEAVNLTRPEILEEIASEYLEVGADIIQTNTFGASPLKLVRFGLGQWAKEINQRAVTVVKKVVGSKAYVSASCGPTGCRLKPSGDTEPEDVYRSFMKQLEYITEIGVDVICIETMTDLTEASLAVRAAKTVTPGTPVMATMTFDETPHGLFTIKGGSVKQAAEVLEKAGADIIGSNCGNGSESMVKVARAFRNCTSLPLIIQPNAGKPELAGGKLIYHESPEFMAEKARELVAIGVSIIGGCCGTTPEHIKALRKMVDSL